jgi:hypothetical protein
VKAGYLESHKSFASYHLKFIIKKTASPVYLMENSKFER